MLNHVLVPLDGSRLAEKALSAALQILQPGGRITLLTVVDAPNLSWYGYYLTPYVSEDLAEVQRNTQNVIAEGKRYLEDIADKLLKNRDVYISLETHTGDPATVIGEIAEALNVDAIVISTHGRSGVNRWIFGSVTQRVLSIAKMPVFIIPNREARVTAPTEDEALGIPQG